MIGEFLFNVVVQFGLLSLLVLSRRIRVASPAGMFSPAAWFVMFYCLVFWLPQLFMPAFDFTLIGAYNIVQADQLPRIVETQRVLLAFLVPAVLLAILSGRRSPGEASFAPLSGGDLRIALVALLLGAVGVAAMLSGLNPDRARSMIVASLGGKFLYAISFWFTLGYMVLAAWLIRKRRYSLLVVVTAVFAAALLPLGGRGRILWPLAGLFAWAAITGHSRIRVWKIALSAACLGVLLQALDPVLLYLRGYDSAEQAVERFNSGLELETVLYGRNFDSFHNLAVIVGEDRVGTNLRFLFDGSQAAFMNAYFPSVAAGGVGYPATLPGGLWLAGRLSAVIFGGAAFGLLLGCLGRIYRRLGSELGVLVYVIAMPWLAHVGISYLESYFKMAALVLPGVALAWLRRQGRGRSSPAAVVTP